MKKLFSLFAVVCFTGCMSGGPVVGPFSYMAANHNEQVMTKRALMSSPAITTEKKAELFKVMAMGGDPKAYSIGMGMDILALTDGSYTWGEGLKSLLGVVSDLALYGGIGLGAKSLTDGGSSDKGNGNLTISGNVSDSQIQNYQGNHNTQANGQNKPFATDNSVAN